MMRWFFCIAVLTFPACVPSQSKLGVVLYSSIDDTYALAVSRDFEKQTGIHVDVVTDSEAAKSTGLAQRLLAEKDRPLADVFWSGDVMRALRLRAGGVAAAVIPQAQNALGVDPQWGFAVGPGRVRLIAFNTELAKRDQAPQGIEDLAKEGIANRSCLANPMFGSSSMHAAMLLQVWGKERAERFFRDFVAHGGRVLASNGEVKRRVANGEFAFGLTDSDDVAVALSEGKHLGYVVPDQGAEGMGAVLIPSVAVVVRGAPHPEAAVKLAQFLSLPSVQVTLRDSDAAFFPLGGDGVATPHKTWDFDLASVQLAPRMSEASVGVFEQWVNSFIEPWLDASQR